MHLDHEGLFYRTAYPFRYRPLRISVCAAWWRFVGLGLWRILASVIVWLSEWMIFVLFGWGFIGIIMLCFGYKFVYTDSGVDDDFSDWIIGGRILYRLSIRSYRTVPNERLSVIAGMRITPALLVGILLILWSGWNIVPNLGVLAGRWATAVYEDSDRILAVGLTTFIIVAAVLLVAIGARLFQKFLETETGKMCTTYIKAKIEKSCPMIEVV